MQTSFIVQAIQSVYQDVLTHEADIEKLDREIGDGDHYINLKRGCQTLQQLCPELAELTAQQALQNRPDQRRHRRPNESRRKRQLPRPVRGTHR